MGASANDIGKRASKFCKFLGDISYPMYITHYPLIYIYTAWVYDKKLSLTQALPVAVLVFFGSIALGYACLKLYDEPLRKWLNKKLLAGGRLG